MKQNVKTKQVQWVYFSNIISEIVSRIEIKMTNPEMRKDLGNIFGFTKECF